ncbi:MAG: M42 family metallopeptidase [Flavobacteriales bacterium]|nr:M42 family metallopeptidase [Flavobacteriales bacterium]MDG2246073.1 M42 family metallopeptidase [Flavobacteriales bacterium]
MPLDIKLLAQICETPGVPGYEKQIRDLIIKEVTPLVDDVSVDNMGNVVALKRGKERKKVMIAAHMDEIGFMVTHIDDNGFCRFHTLGGFDPKTLTSQRVIVHGNKELVGVMGSKPIHIMSPEERTKAPKISDYFIDLGMPAEEVKLHVPIGSPVTRDRELIEMGDCVNCKSIDNRVSVFILLETLRKLQDVPYDVYAVFTVQEEVGIRGAQVATLAIQPDIGLGLDTTIAFDTPGAGAHEKVTTLGKGTAIKIMDASAICDPRMIQFLKKVASEKNILWQPEILTAGGTDTSGIQRMTAGGAITGAISIPTRHIHSVIEMANKSDIDGSIQLLVGALEMMDQLEQTH